jgi:hypothetical protein
MVVNQKVTGRASSVPAGLATGALTGLAITLIISYLAAFMASRELLDRDMFGYCAMAVLILASFVSAKVAVAKIKKMPLQMAAASGLVLYVLLLSMTALFFGGQYDALGVTLVLGLIGSGAGGILASGKPKRRKQKYHKI